MQSFFSYEDIIYLKDYYSPLLIVFLLIYVCFNNFKTGLRIYETLIIPIISLVFSLRYVPSYFSSDTMRYLRVFEELDSFSDVFTNSMAWKQDHFFFMLAFIPRIVSTNYHFTLFFFFALSTLIIYNTLKISQFSYPTRHSLLFLFLIFSSPFFVSLNSNLLRQGLVVSMSFYFFISYKDKKITIKRIILLLSPLLIHKSYLIFLFLFSIYKLLDFKKAFSVLVLVAVFKFTLLQIVKIPLLDKLLQLSTRIDTYGSLEVSGVDFFTAKILFYFVVWAALFIVFKGKQDLKNNLKFVLLILIFSIIFIDFPIISKRILYFIPLVLIKSVQDYLIENSKIKRYLLGIFVVILFQSILMSQFAKTMSNIVYLKSTFNIF